jgi:hypothetical protein
MEVWSKVLSLGELMRQRNLTLPLREDPQEGVNLMPFPLISPTCRERRDDPGPSESCVVPSDFISEIQLERH